MDSPRMNALQMMRQMAQNNAWANLRLHKSVAELTEEEYRATRTSFFPSIHRTLVHIVFVDLYYLNGLQGAGQPRQDIWTEMERFEREEGHAQVMRTQREADRRLLGFVDGLRDEEGLSAEVRLERRDGIKVDRCDAVLLHLFEHQIHHRGQVHAMLSGTRIKPPPLDEFFLAEDQPVALEELRQLAHDQGPAGPVNATL